MAAPSATTADVQPAATTHHYEYKYWDRDGFVISTDPSLVSIAALNAAFAGESLYWAQPLPEGAMREMLANSVCFGLYTPTPLLGESEPARTTMTTTGPPVAEPEPGPNLIGFARLITDRVTFAYVTDVYVLEGWRGQGLGSWLMGCVQEVIEGLPHLRRSLLLTSEAGESTGMGLFQRVRALSFGGGGHHDEAGNAAAAGTATPKGEAGTGAVAYYARTMKMAPIHSPLVVMSWTGPGAVV